MCRACAVRGFELEILQSYSTGLLVGFSFFFCADGDYFLYTTTLYCMSLLEESLFEKGRFALYRNPHAAKILLFCAVVVLS
jgi:hypothetical protein